MKHFILSTLLCLMMPCLAKADNVKTYNFSKERGAVAYGATMKDEYGPLHYVQFHTNDAKVTKLGRVDENDNGTRMNNLRCGAFCGDKYYGYIVSVYTYTEQVKSYGTVDFSTGKFNVIRTNYDKTEREAWPIMYEMTYDNTNKICYALGRNMDGLVVSDLYKVDIATGEYEKLATLDFYAWAMACDYEGNIYMVKGIPDKNDEFYIASSLVRIDQNDGYAEKDEKRIKVKGADYIPNYTHSMEFNHENNKLYWLAMSNDGWQKMYNIDIETGNAVETANMMYNMVTGLYIPFNGADSRQAAGAVTGLSGKPAADGSYKAALQWTNPVINWKGDALEALSSVTVAKESRDNVIATLDAADGMGSKMTFSDENAQKGYNVYYITTHRLDGENGLTDSVRVFVGPDTPGRPQNVTTTAEDNNVRVNWIVPATGQHGEKFDIASTVYDITRMPDNKLLAEGVKETTYLDTEIGAKKEYTYIVKARNAEGEGLSEESTPIIIGNAYELPFSEAFDTEVCKKMWSTIDANNDGMTFEWAGGGKEDFNRYQIWLNNQFDANDYMITPPLATKAGARYRVNYDVQMGRMEDLHKFVIVTGNAPTLEGMTNRADSVDNLKAESYNQIKSFESKFTADGSETYVGVQCMSYKSDAGSYFAVRNFHVEEIFASDLAVTGIEGTKDLVKDQPSELIVKVKNMGYETSGSYKVEIITKDEEGNISVIGSADVSEALAADNIAAVKVAATPVTEGKAMVSARVVAEGDMNAANDTFAWTEYNVNPAGTADWNLIVKAGTEEKATTEPMNFYNVYSTVESVYLKDEIKAEKDGKITRIAYNYSENDLSAETEPFEVKIYMCNTDKGEYQAEVSTDDWTPLDQMTLVCTKNVTLVPGKDNLMTFDLDTPFEYDHTKNLCIQVWKESYLEDRFPVLFDVYNFGYEVYRSLRYNTNRGAFDFEDPNNFFPINNIPVLHMAVDFENHSGIINIDGSNGVSYNGGILAISNGMLKDVMVTDVTGMVIYSGSVNAPQLNLSLGRGLYIIKAVDGEGRTHVLKVAGK